MIDQQLLPFAPISYAVGVRSLQEKIPLPLSTIALANVLPLTITFYITFISIDSDFRSAQDNLATVEAAMTVEEDADE